MLGKHFRRWASISSTLLTLFYVVFGWVTGRRAHYKDPMATAKAINVFADRGQKVQREAMLRAERAVFEAPCHFEDAACTANLNIWT